MNRSALLLVPESKNERKSRIAPRITRDRVKGDDLLFRSLNRLFVPRTVDKGSHIQCLDQLYVQAIVANTMLVQKVQQWAAKSNGYFRLKKQEEPNPRARPLSWLAIATEKGLLEDRLANAHHNTPQEAKFVKVGETHYASPADEMQSWGCQISGLTLTLDPERSGRMLQTSPV